MKFTRRISVLLSVIMILAAVPVSIFGVPVETRAAATFYKSGEIELKKGSANSNIWLYEGATGKFTSEEDIASFAVEDDDIVNVTEKGKYSAYDLGTTVLTVELDDDEETTLTFKLHVVEYPKNLKLSPKSKKETKPTQDSSSAPTTQFKIKGLEDMESDVKVEFAVKEGDMTPTFSRSGNVVTLKSYKGGKCTIGVTVNGVETTFKWELKAIKCEPMVLSPGTSKAVSLTNAKASSFEWSSQNEKIATISSGGKITAKKAGNAVIVGENEDDGYKVGCVVSVTTPEKVKAITRAKEIATGTYSQGKRMQTGYYDCSSLVWRAYSPYGFNFGVKSGYAPTAATEAQYIDSKKNMYATWKAKDMKKMLYAAGDLMFRTNTGNGRYRGINHVEMITGYEVVSFDSDGDAQVLCDWASKSPDYSSSIYEHDIIGRL